MVVTGETIVMVEMGVTVETLVALRSSFILLACHHVRRLSPVNRESEIITLITIMDNILSLMAS